MALRDWRLSVALLVVLAAGCHRASAPPPEARADPESRRTLAGGEVVGFVGEYGSYVWMGIPYAKPPVGALRWRAPEPPESWSGSRSATAPPPVCTQFPSRFAGVEGDAKTPSGQEDCLYLNVYAPRRESAEKARLPVLFWIHGGGNVIGHASFYDGGNLAEREHVVVVALNYRLGPLGWFRHEGLRGSAASDADRSGNYGTLDLVRGLEWVRDNVSAFGGDPGNVTIFGESAGGRDVFTLLLSPKARGLFHRAIVESGGTETLSVEDAERFADSTPAGHRNSSSEILLRLLRADGKASSRAEAKALLEKMGPSEVESYLRGKPAAQILAAYKTEDSERLIDVPQLFRDGAVLPAGEPLERLRAGDYNRVPTIFGTNHDENKTFLAVNPEYVSWVLGLVPRIRDPKRYEATARHLSALWKATGADAPAGLMRAAQGPSVWVYRFDWDEEPKQFLVDVSQLLGAAHGFEIPFVFGHWQLGSQTGLFFDAGNEPGRRELSAKMMSYWASFARSGDPNQRGSLQRWNAFDGDRSFLVLDTELGGGVRMEKGVTTVEGVIAAVDADPDLPTAEAKCDVYRRLVEWNRGIPRERYPKLGAHGCADYPLPEPKLG